MSTARLQRVVEGEIPPAVWLRFDVECLDTAFVPATGRPPTWPERLVTFHDLRHTGNTLAASTGASTKKLMNRLGHASAQAALRYQHATAARDKAIALALSELTERALGPLRMAAVADGCAMDPIRRGG